MKALVAATALWIGMPLSPQAPLPPGPALSPTAFTLPSAPGLITPLPFSLAPAPLPTATPVKADLLRLNPPVQDAAPTSDLIGDVFDGRALEPKGLELDEDFTALHAEVRGGKADPLPESARAVRYLFVGGMFASREKDYFGANLRRLDALGLEASLVPIDTQGRRRAGLRAIEAAVRDAQGPVVLIGHSRGGVLVHDWFRGAPTELKAKVKRLVLIQAPLAGTPFADWALTGRWNRFRLHWLGRLVFGANLLRTGAEMTPRMRRRVLDSLPAWGPEDREKVYTLRTTISALHGFYEKRRVLLKRLGVPESDGMVPVDSARVEGGRNVLLRDLEHKHTVLQRPGWITRIRGYRPHPTHDAGDMTEALVRLLFR